MARCSVCSEKAYVNPCAHCDKKCWDDCKEAHCDILRREISRVNNQVKRGWHRLEDCVQQVSYVQLMFSFSEKATKYLRNPHDFDISKRNFCGLSFHQWISHFSQNLFILVVANTKYFCFRQNESLGHTS